MFTFPNLPTQSSSQSELADFFELVSIKRGQASKSDVASHLSMVSDNLYNSGCDDEDDQIADILDGVMIEFQRRQEACGIDGYPFTINSTGTLLIYHGNEAIQGSSKKIAYLYLLLSTRLNMNGNRRHADIDGTTILEELAAATIQSYLGCRSFSVNFGTSTSGGFDSKVNNLCQQFGEGGQHKVPNGAMRHTQDGKLDTVGWIPFSDNLEGKLSVFGQCKTGTNWKDSISQLQPNSFIKKFMTNVYHIDPLRAFFVSESVDRSRWHDMTIDAGLLFDRWRIVDFCPALHSNVLDKTKNWTEAAMNAVTI